MTDFEELYYLGCVQIFLCEQQAHVSNRGTSVNDTNESTIFDRALEEQTVEQVDCAQIIGILPRRFTDFTPKRQVHVSNVGVKFLDPTTKRCTERLALHKVIQCICYDAEVDHLQNLVLLQQADKNNAVAHLFQTENPEMGEQLCRRFNELFDQLQREGAEIVRQTREHAQQERREANEQRRLRQMQLPPRIPTTPKKYSLSHTL